MSPSPARASSVAWYRVPADRVGARVRVRVGVRVTVRVRVRVRG